MQRLIALATLVYCSCAAALVVSPIAPPRTAARPSSSRAAVELLSPAGVMPATALLAEIVDAGGERAYGAVDAPGWVLPVLAVAAIGTSLLPLCVLPRTFCTCLAYCSLGWRTPPACLFSSL